MSAHRLLPSIVFASTSLLAGCGGQLDAQTTFPEPPPPDAAGDVAVATPDAAHDAEPDARTCEGGWPTTKGQICQFDGGISCCRNSWEEDAGLVCCEVGEK